MAGFYNAILSFLNAILSILNSILSIILSIFNVVLSFLNQVVTILFEVVTWVLNAVIWLITEIIYVTLDGFFSVIIAFVNGIDLSGVMPYIQSSWGTLPAQIIWLGNAIGFPQGLALLGSAYLIRMLLNLIPAVFTRI